MRTKLKYLLNDLKRDKISEWDIKFVETLLDNEQKHKNIDVLGTLKSIRGSLQGLGASQYDIKKIEELIKKYDNHE